MFLATAGQADAATMLTFTYEGVTDTATGDTSEMQSAMNALFGQTLRIEFTFDAATPDNLAQGDLGSYGPPGPGVQISATIGPNTYTVQYSTDLENWMSIPAGETNTSLDTTASGCRNKFYRVLEQ